MLSKPWLQILIFVIGYNVAQSLLFVVSASSGLELVIFISMMFSSLFATWLLVLPQSVTTGHKLLTLTVAATTMFFAVGTLAIAWTMAGYQFAWYIYSYINTHFLSTMMFFTVLEFLCVFANTGVRMGRVGEYFGSAIDYIYSSVLLRVMRKANLFGI